MAKLMGKYPRVRDYVEHEECPDCRKRKPGYKSDCAIYQAVFMRMEPNAIKNLDKFFTHKGCKYFDMKGGSK